MLNRRHLRIKVLQSLYAYFQEDERNMAKAEKELFFSLDKFHELYIYLLCIMQRLHLQRKHKMEIATRKLLPTDAERNPVKNFVDNSFLLELEANIPLEQQTEVYKIQWDEDRLDIVRDAYAKMLVLPEYVAYMELEKPAKEDDLKIVVKIFKECVVNNDIIQHHFDEASVFWADDLDLAASMVIKTIKTWKEIKEFGTGKLLPLYKEEVEEKDFVKQLFRNTITQSVENENYIDSKTKNWDLDRIAFMDVILMKMALAEARTFKQIPTKVTINEYLELSKYYSTPKSSTFINGVLDNLFIELKKSGEIKKMGRGLLES